MPYETILTDVSDNIFTITINRPDKLNALEHADDPRSHRRVRCGGCGRGGARDHRDRSGQGRSAPARTSRPGQAPSTARGAHATGRKCRTGRMASRISPTIQRATAVARITLRIFNCHKPVIARDQRPGGRHRRHDAAPDGHPHRLRRGALRLPVLPRGIVPVSASRSFLPRIVGIAQALDWCFSGRVFGADEALKGGLISRVVASGELIATARAIARELLRDDLGRVGGTDPPDALAHARREPSDGGAPHR